MDLPAHQVPLQDVRTRWVHQQELLATLAAELLLAQPPSQRASQPHP